MKIAIQAADLDHERIDGTRVYLLNVLRHLGKISPSDEFLIYHKSDFNPELTPPSFSNYKIKRINFPFLWTQTRFTLELLKDKPDALWMPMHNIPIIRSNKIKTTITVHDLAFKYFPDCFPKKDLFELNTLLKLAVNKSDKIIAVSDSTKRDILKFYPKIIEEKIKVIHHGFDAELFQKEVPQEKTDSVLGKYKLSPPRRDPERAGKTKNYILYVGAIQPRKNLEALVEAFDLYKKDNPDIKLVLAGGKAWQWEGTMEKINDSPYKNDIIVTGTIDFDDMVVLYRNADIFVFPSLYEGFGIPILEAFASGVPVVCANNSSLPEVGGDAVKYFDNSNQQDLYQKIKGTLENEELRSALINKGKERLHKFSWEKCARETLEWIKS